MESKKTLACPVEEDLKTSKEESSKPEENQSELVVEDCKTLTPFELSAKFSRDTNSGNQGNAGFFPALLVAIYFLSTHYVKAIWCYLMSGFLNAPHGPATRFLNRVYSKILGSMRCLCSVASVYGALIVISRIPGASASGKCVGNSDLCLILAQNGTEWFDDGTKWFDEYNDCMNVRCLHLSKGQDEELGNFPNLEELFMDDMGNITIPCDVLKNLSKLLKIDLHVKNIFPTDACNTSCVLSEVTVAVLHNTTAISCNLTEWMPKLISVSFENDQAPTSVPPGIISESVTTTAGNMVNQEKDAGFSVSFKNDQAPTSVPTEITSEGVFTTPGNMVNQEKDTGIGVGVVIGVFALGVVVGIGVGIVVVILLHRNNIIKIVCKKSSTPVQVLYTCASGVKMSDQCESESVV